MNQQCKVCGEPAAGFHFGAFTCEGCKSFFGRTYNNLSSISECKNNGECIINKKNRTACKACRLRKCLYVGMSKSGSRYGRRSNWFKIHCLLQEQQHQHQTPSLSQPLHSSNQHLMNPLSYLLPSQQLQQQNSYQNTNKSSSPLKSSLPPNPCLFTNPFMSVGRNLLNGRALCSEKNTIANHRASSNSSSDSGASSAGPEDSIVSNKEPCQSPGSDPKYINKLPTDSLEPIRSISEPLNHYHLIPHVSAASASTPPTQPTFSSNIQEEPIDLSVKSQKRSRTASPKLSTTEGVLKHTPLDLTLVRSNVLTG